MTASISPYVAPPTPSVEMAELRRQNELLREANRVLKEALVSTVDRYKRTLAHSKAEAAKSASCGTRGASAARGRDGMNEDTNDKTTHNDIYCEEPLWKKGSQESPRPRPFHASAAGGGKRLLAPAASEVRTREIGRLSPHHPPGVNVHLNDNSPNFSYGVRDFPDRNANRYDSQSPTRTRHLDDISTNVIQAVVERFAQGRDVPGTTNNHNNNVGTSQSHRGRERQLEASRIVERMQREASNSPNRGVRPAYGAASPPRVFLEGSPRRL